MWATKANIMIFFVHLMLSKNNFHPLLQNNNELKYNIEIDKITPSKRFIGDRDLDSRRFLRYASDVLVISLDFWPTGKLPKV